MLALMLVQVKELALAQVLGFGQRIEQG